mgnify:FL=1
MSLGADYAVRNLKHIDDNRDKSFYNFDNDLGNDRSDNAHYLHNISCNFNRNLDYNIPLAEIALKHIGVHALVVGVDGGVGCVGFDYLALVYLLLAVNAVCLECERILCELNCRIARLFGDIFKIKPLVIVILDTVLAGSGARVKYTVPTGSTTAPSALYF